MEFRHMPVHERFVIDGVKARKTSLISLDGGNATTDDDRRIFVKPDQEVKRLIEIGATFKPLMPVTLALDHVRSSILIPQFEGVVIQVNGNEAVCCFRNGLIIVIPVDEFNNPMRYTFSYPDPLPYSRVMATEIEAFPGPGVWVGAMLPEHLQTVHYLGPFGGLQVTRTMLRNPAVQPPQSDVIGEYDVVGGWWRILGIPYCDWWVASGGPVGNE